MNEEPGSQDEALNEESGHQQSKVPAGSMMGVGIVIGAAIGIAIGTAIDNVGAGIAIGMGVGVAMGAAFSRGARGEDS